MREPRGEFALAVMCVFILPLCPVEDSRVLRVFLDKLKCLLVLLWRLCQRVFFG